MTQAISIPSIAAAALLAVCSAFVSAQAAPAANGGRGAAPLDVFSPAAPAVGDLVINLAGIESFDQEDAPINTVISLDVVPGVAFDRVAYDLTLSTVNGSWLSEARILITNSAGVGVLFTPGFGDDHPGTASYSDSLLLSDYGLSFNALADGKLTLQFYEKFDDQVGVADAYYTSGTLIFSGVSAVPEPSAFALLGVGLLGLGLAGRRSRP